MVYRPDIDGLRALAVLGVVIHHAFPTLLPGGFVGVDIFFVISGYLITIILLQEGQSGPFDLKRFYLRRIRRLLPALILVLAASLVCGWWVLLADEYRQLAKHVVGAGLFVVNFMLFGEAGYFDVSSQLKPLLHLWSLGIEEQFYIVWPLLLYFFAKRSWNILSLILVVALLSFGLNVWQVGSNPSAAFYSPLSRSWELALGAFLAYQVMHPAKVFTAIIERHGSLVSGLGLLMVVIGFVVINESRAFPGWWALLPAMGSAFLIASGPHRLVNRFVLSQRIFVWVGLISFPLYLWHWPLLSFARIIYSETPPLDVRAILVIVSITMAALTYYLVEKPIRQSSSKRTLIVALSALMLCVGVAGFVVYKTKGFQARHAGLLNANPVSLEMGADRKRWANECGIPLEAKKILNSCYSPKDQKAIYAVWGDSKGEAIFYGLAREAINQQTPAWMMIGNAIPMTGDIPRLKGRSFQQTQYALNAIVSNKDIEFVLLVPAVRSIFSLSEVYTRESMDASPHFDESLFGVSNAIGALEDAGKRVGFLVDHPGFPDPKSCISGGLTKNDFFNQFLFRKENPLCSMTYEQHVHINERYRLWIKALQAKHPSLIVYDPTHLVCDVANNHCGIAKDGQFLYSYGDHYSDYGNSMIAKDFLAKLPSLLKK